MKCSKHPSVDAVATCERCNVGICATCADVTKGAREAYGTLCVSCYKKACHEEIAYSRKKNSKIMIRLIMNAVSYVIGLITLIVGASTSEVFPMALGMALCGLFGIIDGWKRADAEQDEHDRKHGASYTIQANGDVTRDKNWVGRIVYITIAFTFGLISTPIRVLRYILEYKDNQAYVTVVEGYIAKAEAA